LLNLYGQSQGTAGPATSSSEAALKEAIAVAKLSAAELVSGGSDSGLANQLNVYA
jgi:hypothetical protein